MASIGTFKSEQLHPSTPDANQWLVLSLTQPWASALFIPGLKRVETRGWRTQYRGRLYIHASKAMPRYAKEFANASLNPGRAHFQNLPLGAIIGSVDLVDMRRTEDLVSVLSETEQMFGDYSPRRYGWITGNPQLLPDPIPAKGQLGLWLYSKPEVGATHG